MVQESTTRRHLLRGATGLGIVGLSGCLRMIGGSGDSNQPRDASFRFTQSDEQLRIVYDGGGSLVAQQLEIRSNDGTVATWNELGSTGIQADTTLSSDATATVGPSVVNWDQPVTPETTIQVVYMVDGESPSTLATFEPSDTSTGLSSPTESGSKSGSSPAGVLDDFEDTELDWTITEGTRSNLTFSSESVNGSQSLFFNDSSNRVILRRDLAQPGQIDGFSFWFKYNSQQDNNFRVSLWEDGSKLIEIREFGRTIHYKSEGGSGVTAESVASIEQDTWFQVVLSDIDFQANTLSIAVVDANGQTIGQETGVDFWSAVDRVTSVRILNGLEARSGQPGAADPLWIDYIRLEAARSDSSSRVYDDFEDSDLTNPGWEAVGGGPGGLAPENEIGIAEGGHDSQYAMYVDQGGSISNFSAQSTLNGTVSPSTFSFWLQPTDADQYTKNQLRLVQGDTVGIRFNNHIQNDSLYFRFGDGNDEGDRQLIRDSAIAASVGRFVEVRLEEIDWQNSSIGSVYIDGQLTAQDAPFENSISGFDTIGFAAIGGGDTVFRIDDITWR